MVRVISSALFLALSSCGGAAITANDNSPKPVPPSATIKPSPLQPPAEIDPVPPPVEGTEPATKPSS